MTDGEIDVSKAALCTMLCADRHIGVTKFANKIREHESTKYSHSRYDWEYYTGRGLYQREETAPTLFIDELHKSIYDKIPLCVNSCHSARSILNKNHKYEETKS